MPHDIADADRASLAAGEFTRRGVLWVQGAGMLATSVLFTIDAYRGSFHQSRAYNIVYNLPGGAWTWSLWALTSSVTLLAGMFTHRWRFTLAGLLGLAVWYAGQTTIVILNWHRGGQLGLIGPIGVYGLVLFPKAITHAVTVVLTGRRLGAR